jgi:hypothetical protein
MFCIVPVFHIRRSFRSEIASQFVDRAGPGQSVSIVIAIVEYRIESSNSQRFNNGDWAWWLRPKDTARRAVPYVVNRRMRVTAAIGGH